MATLAALDVARELEAGSGALPSSQCELLCYTYGAPRTGNHAFARDYRRSVPNTWQVINGGLSILERGKKTKPG